jgi:ABC-2 type transport system ATP-binding protein
MIEIKGLVKKFGPITAVDGVSFGAVKGEVVGFLGPNGAGKSTTMKMVVGFLPSTAGTAVVCGHDVTQEPLQVKKAIGYLPEGAPAYPDMTPESFLRFVAEVRGFTGSERRKRIDRVASLVHLEGVMRQPIETLSKGYKRRVGLAQALIHDPEVLIMDEPTDGLDPNQKHEVRELIRSMASEKTIVLSTHILEEVEAVCTRTVIIARGKVLFDGTPERLAARSKYHNAVVVRVLEDPNGQAKQEIARAPGVARVEERGAELVAIASNGQSIVTEVSQHVRSAGLKVEEIRVETGRLDEVFREITTG